MAGGIPIIRPIKQCLAGNHISEVMGIVNGTTNFNLTKMSQNGMEFADALKLAQDLDMRKAIRPLMWKVWMREEKWRSSPVQRSIPE